MRSIGKLLLLVLVIGSLVSPLIVVSSRTSFSQGGSLIFLPFVPRGYNHSNSVLPFGVQISQLGNGQTANLANEMGAGWIRAGLSWNDLEPANTTPENFNWSAYDAGLQAAALAGLQPIITVTDIPPWAGAISCGPVNSANLQDYVSFLQAVVSRYGTAPYNVHHWEIYNEPDNTDLNRYWLGGCWGGKGKEYADLLRVAYPAIKAADPQAQVVFGSLAYDWFTNQGGPFERNFIDDVLSPSKGNGGAYFDIMAFHYYVPFRDSWEPYGTDVIGKTSYLRDKLASYGISKPMAVTEMSQWNKSTNNGGSDEEQMAYVVQSFARSMAAGLRFSIWFTLIDYNDWGYGFFNADRSQKPSYTTYNTLSSMMAGAVYSGPLQIGGTEPSNVEGYTFTMPGGRQRHVLWAKIDGTVSVGFPGSGASIIDKNGGVSTLADSTDGAVDGHVNVSVTKSPIYVDVLP